MLGRPPNDRDKEKFLIGAFIDAKDGLVFVRQQRLRPRRRGLTLALPLPLQ
jgi:hypothetical protein